MKSIYIISLFLTIFLPFTSASSECKNKKEVFNEPNFRVLTSKYIANHSTKKSIIIFPPTGGSNYIDRDYAKNLCKEGFNVFILDKWTNDNEHNFQLSIHERFYSKALRAIQLVVSNIEAQYIGVLGTSVGAIHTVNAIKTITEINAVFLITGGAPISEVIAYSDQDVLVQARKIRFKEHNYKNILAYEKDLRNSISFNFPSKPLNKKIKIGMIIANKDTTVPTKNQLYLYKALTPEQVIYVQGGHLYTILKTWFCYQKNIITFFRNSSSTEEL